MYGDHYWHEHMTQVGLSITGRARADLVERAQYWLRDLLKYRLPPGRVLEVGCAHGGFLKLLQLSGFDVVGMEMSPAIIEIARQWFGVTVVQGPIEYAKVELGKFDVIVMLDVIEHLADPVHSTRRVVEHLADDGILMVQTPCHENVVDPKWRMFHPPEHTFLFTRESIRQLLGRMGFGHLAFEPAIFADDMFVFASRQSLAVHSAEEIAARLVSTPDGRMALAMQELYAASQLPRASDLSTYYGGRWQLGLSFFRGLALRRFRARLGMRRMISRPRVVI